MKFEKFPYEHLFNQFMKEVKPLEAEKDVVNGIAREYISTARLNPIYQKVFKDQGLLDASIRHRLANIIDPQEFPDDFISLSDTVNRWEPKYFVNRLNKKLLMKIYLPQLGTDIQTTMRRTKLLEDNFREFSEFDEWDE